MNLAVCTRNNWVTFSIENYQPTFRKSYFSWMVYLYHNIFVFLRYSFLEQCLLLSEKHAVISAYLFAYLWTEFYQQEPCIILHFPADSSKQKQLERLIFKPLFLGDNWQKSFLSEKSAIHSSSNTLMICHFHC